MNAGIERRLKKLEGGGGAANGLGNLAATIEAGRKRVHLMSPEQLQDEQRAKLAEMELQHGERPFRGLALELLLGRRRVAAARAAGATP